MTAATEQSGRTLPDVRVVYGPCYAYLNIAAMSRTEDRFPTPASEFTALSGAGDCVIRFGLGGSLFSEEPSEHKGQMKTFIHQTGMTRDKTE